MSLAVLHQWGEEINFASVVAVENHADDFLFGVFHHRLAGEVAACLSYTGEQEAQEIVDFGCGAYGASWIAVDGFLLNGNHGRQTGYFVYVRTLK